jgi:hypothetical protein
MSVCEKCWSDSRQYRDGEDGAYRALLAERKADGKVCTPEEQAGPDALICTSCGRRVLHQHTRECMAGCAAVLPDREGK